MSLQTGQVLEQRYRIEALLGQGGMGAVYRAVDLKFNTPVALKENLTVTPDSQRQFTREAGLLHQLRHPNLPRVTDHFTIAGQGQYLVMDHVEGEDLKGLLARQGPLPEAQALNWICQVLDALEYLHSRQVIHRDVKPANVKITPQGQVFLVDFGLAKVYDPGQETTIGARGATPGYAPPEQYGQGRTDARSDVYSAGATLYSLVSGQVPPDALDMVIRRGELPSLRHLAPGVSAHIEAAVTRAMQTIPEDRFQTSAEFRQALHEPPTRALPPRRMEPVRDKPAAQVAEPPPQARPTPPVDTHQRIAALLAGARTALDQQDWDGAEGRCQAALALDSQHVGARQVLQEVNTGRQLDSHYARAVAAMQAGDWEAATSALEQVTVLDAGYRDARALMHQVEAERQRPTPTPPPPPAPSEPRPPGFAERAGEALSGVRERLPAPTARFLLISILVVVALLIIVPSILLILGNGGAGGPADQAPLGQGDGILLTSNRDGKREIYRLHAGQSERLTETPSRWESWSPVWSETGVLFTSNLDGKREIYRLADGQPERATHTPGDGESWGAVSTDTGILFTSNRDGKREIYRLHDGQVERATHTPGDGESWGAVSTDTGHLFTSSRDGKVEIYRLHGGQVERATHTPGGGESWSPSWTDTGILFTSTRDGKRELYRLHAGEVERATHTPGDAESWAFDPEE